MKQDFFLTFVIQLAHYKRYCKVMLAIGLALPTVAYSTNGYASLKYDSTKPIYDESKLARSVGDIDALLKDANSKGQRVLFYLHGRGDEPEKSFDPKMTGGGVFGRLSSEYGVRVILINWNSKAKGTDRSEPLSKVEEGATTFNRVLANIVEFQRLNPAVPRPALLVHSMGSIVISSQVQKHGWPAAQGKPIFSNILFSQPDSDSQGHAEWLSKVAASERVYVTQNLHDSVLKLSTNARSPESNFALGLKPVEPLASNVSYVNLTEALRIKTIFFVYKLGAHPVFTKSWMGGNVSTCVFITKILVGEKFEPIEIAGVSLLSAGRYSVAANVDNNHYCFKQTVANDDNE